MIFGIIFGPKSSENVLEVLRFRKIFRVRRRRNFDETSVVFHIFAFQILASFEEFWWFEANSIKIVQNFPPAAGNFINKDL